MDAWFSYLDILIKLEWDGLLNVERKKKIPQVILICSQVWEPLDYIALSSLGSYSNIMNGP